MSIQFHDAGDVKTALLLTMLGACGTALGGLIVVAQPDMSLSRLGLLQVPRTRLLTCLRFRLTSQPPIERTSAPWARI